MSHSRSFLTILRVALPVALAGFSWAVPSAAQTIELSAQGPTRANGLDSSRKLPFWINHAECVADDVFTFTGIVTNFTSQLSFEVWAGQNCTDQNNRIRDQKCWLVYRGKQATRNMTVDIPVRRIVARNREQSSVSDETEDVCFNAATGATPLFFMYVDGNDETVGSDEWQETGVDTSGPVSPTNVKVSTGEQGLPLSWSVPDATDIVGYNFYCAENEGTASSPITPTTPTSQGDAGAGDAGTGGSANTNEETATSTDTTEDACGSPELTPDAVPPVNLKRCGSESPTATNGFARGLANGTEYVVGIAAVDELGNAGPLSNVSCGTPENLTSFFEAYRAAGGEGGGGICTIALPGIPKNPLALVLAVLGLLSAFRLRRVHQR